VKLKHVSEEMKTLKKNRGSTFAESKLKRILEEMKTLKRIGA
jgi:hypothetical protein